MRFKVFKMNFSTVLAMKIFMVTLCLMSGTVGIRCYHCDYCFDPFNPNEANITECLGSCLKVKYPHFVHRECYGNLDQQGEDSCSVVTHGDLIIEGCYCNSDLCNSAANQELSVHVAVLLFTAVCILK